MSGLFEPSASHDVGYRPGQRFEVGRVFDVACHRVGLGEVEAHRALAHGPNRQGRREQHRVVDSPPSRPSVDATWTSAALSTPAALNWRADPGPRRQSIVVKIVEHCHGAPRSSSADRSATSAAGGCQENTPRGVPSATGVSGPHIPRGTGRARRRDDRLGRSRVAASAGSGAERPSTAAPAAGSARGPSPRPARPGR